MSSSFVVPFGSPGRERVAASVASGPAGPSNENELDREMRVAIEVEREGEVAFRQQVSDAVAAQAAARFQVRLEEFRRLKKQWGSAEDREKFTQAAPVSE